MTAASPGSGTPSGKPCGRRSHDLSRRGHGAPPANADHCATVSGDSGPDDRRGADPLTTLVGHAAAEVPAPRCPRRPRPIRRRYRSAARWQDRHGPGPSRPPSGAPPAMPAPLGTGIGRIHQLDARSFAKISAPPPAVIPCCITSRASRIGLPTWRTPATVSAIRVVPSISEELVLAVAGKDCARSGVEQGAVLKHGDRRRHRVERRLARGELFVADAKAEQDVRGGAGVKEKGVKVSSGPRLAGARIHAPSASPRERRRSAGTPATRH